MATLSEMGDNPPPEDLHRWADEIVADLCSAAPDRRPGSPGNAEATAYIAGLLSQARHDAGLSQRP